MIHHMDLRTAIGGLILKNPVMTASGTFGYGLEFHDLVDLSRLGAIVVKGLSIEPSIGNPPPRIWETPCGMLNAIGLENIGVEAFIAQKLPRLLPFGTPIIANIYGKEVAEYAALAGRLDEAQGVSAIEVNISCPNVTCGGMAFGTDPLMAYGVIRAVRLRTRLPVIAKLSPNVTDITRIARSAVDAGADALSLINTLTGMAIDIHTRKPRLANITGGLSGPAIKPVALRMVWQVSQACAVPVIGIGGIVTAEDAVEFLIAGASAVQVGSANFVNVQATTDIIDGIERFMTDQGITRLDELIGSLKTGPSAGGAAESPRKATATC